MFLTCKNQQKQHLIYNIWRPHAKARIKLGRSYLNKNSEFWTTLLRTLSKNLKIFPENPCPWSSLEANFICDILIQGKLSFKTTTVAQTLGARWIPVFPLSSSSSWRLIMKLLIWSNLTTRGPPGPDIRMGRLLAICFVNLVSELAWLVCQPFFTVLEQEQ